jgi:acyl-CoA thioesterase
MADVPLPDGTDPPRTTDGQLPDDPLLRVCPLAYASDMTLLDAVPAGHGVWPSVISSGTTAR